MIIDWIGIAQISRSQQREGQDPFKKLSWWRAGSGAESPYQPHADRHGDDIRCVLDAPQSNQPAQRPLFRVDGFVEVLQPLLVNTFVVSINLKLLAFRKKPLNLFGPFQLSSAHSGHVFYLLQCFPLRLAQWNLSQGIRTHPSLFSGSCERRRWPKSRSYGDSGRQIGHSRYNRCPETSHRRKL